MRKMVLEEDSIVIDGVELTYNEIREKIMDSYKYKKLSDFIQTTFKEDGVSNG